MVMEAGNMPHIPWPTRFVDSMGYINEVHTTDKHIGLNIGLSFRADDDKRITVAPMDANTLQPVGRETRVTLPAGLDNLSFAIPKPPNRVYIDVYAKHNGWFGKKNVLIYRVCSISWALTKT
jgi:hypothetical protein